MADVEIQLYQNFRYETGEGGAGFDTHVFKVILVTDAYVVDLDAHTVLADVSANELAAVNGYAGAVTLTGGLYEKLVDGTHKCKRSWGDVNWTAAGGDLGGAGVIVSGAILYDDTDASDRLVGFIDTPDGVIGDTESYALFAPYLTI